MKSHPIPPVDKEFCRLRVSGVWFKDPPRAAVGKTRPGYHKGTRLLGVSPRDEPRRSRC